MASAPKQGLPILYKDLAPLNSKEHGSWKSKSVDKAPWVAKQHAIPLTVEEFPQAQRSFPIVFSAGDNPVPLALMGLNEGANVFFEEDGSPIGTPYIPAYVRRYPFLLAKLQQGSEDLSLCFDPSSDMLGDFKEGREIFDKDGKPTQHTQELLAFCQKFEEAGMKTNTFMEELTKAELLMDGEVAINRQDGQGQPFIYRGFKMVNQDKLREMRGDQLRKWNENGMLPLIFAHLFSLDLMRVIFAQQSEQGKGPSIPANAAEAAPVN
ncbi:SapC family protein [Alteraurantiacibacter aquimixticola]|uniref:Multidrug transporter n=1 Tax=Alteraurantiacibacter aquimixticola TaxID=2489173 RepID=A0A4T3F2M6_9SPHN|nr:SapC family protein [Alteraurantiacibacter aquimixticola]TIX50340.1 multidrug transporter [Alteraurantiacibacter aquimixticola]